VDKWAVIFRPLIHNLLTERSVFDQLLLNQSTLNFEISCPKPLTHSADRLPLAEGVCDYRLEEFGVWENAWSTGALEQNAKASVVGLDHSRAGSMRLSDRLLDECVDPGSDL
jgi:hypothetical protein